MPLCNLETCVRAVRCESEDTLVPQAFLPAGCAGLLSYSFVSFDYKETLKNKSSEAAQCFCVYVRVGIRATDVLSGVDEGVVTSAALCPRMEYELQ